MDKYFLHCDFSQEWVKFQEWISVIICLSEYFLSVSKHRLISMEYYPGIQTPFLTKPPKPPSQADMDDLPDREGSGESYRNGNGKLAW